MHEYISLVRNERMPSSGMFFQAFISYTGGQSVSHVLLWQPSECVHLIVMIVLYCFSENKYDDDDG